MRTSTKDNTKPKDLLIDFSSDLFVVAEMSESGEVAVLGSVPVEIEINGGAAAHRVPDLRKNFPHIVNSQLRSLCWRSILDSVAAFTPDRSFRMHAILPQTWRWQEASEFHKALAGLRGTNVLRVQHGHLVSETTCLAGILAPLLGQLQELQKKEPLRLLVLCGEPEGCRHWALDLFTSVSPALLRLREYAPAWCANPRLPDAAEAGAAIIMGEQSTASRELDRSGFSGERLARSSMLEGASRVLRPLNGQPWTGEELRLEMAPSLGWRMGSDAPEPLIEPGVLLDPASFPLPKMEREWILVSEAENWGDLAFSLEAGWGSLPESWSPLATVQVPCTQKETIRLVLEMPSPGGGIITAQAGGRSDSADFKLVSGVARNRDREYRKAKS